VLQVQGLDVRVSKTGVKHTVLRRWLDRDFLAAEALANLESVFPKTDAVAAHQTNKPSALRFPKTTLSQTELPWPQGLVRRPN
jgi:hypothetical protein